jgi:hypothetical protein
MPEHVPASPEALEFVRDSLLRRMRTMHSLYYEAVDTMVLDQVNTVVAPGVLPIAFPLFHYTNLHDAAFMGISGALPIWNEEWQARVQMAIDTHGKDEPPEKMIDQRIGDYEAFKAYQREVFDRTEAHIEAVDGADFERVIVVPPYPPPIQNTYSERCAGPRGITVLDAIECWLYQHGLRHMGEIEMIRGFFGLGGVTA